MRQHFNRLLRTFQYPTSGRTAWSWIGTLFGAVRFPFSTLPRVELPGASLQFVGREIYLDFQYPTSGRTAWSTGLGTYLSQVRTLSVPYLGSNCLEPVRRRMPPVGFS